MARILITGIDGFTGLHLANAFLARGDEVHGLLRDASVIGLDSRIVRHVADLSSTETMRRILEAAQPDKIIHLAAIAFVGHADADAFYEVNLLGTRHLLEAAIHVSPDSILLVSSANIYGNRYSQAIDENILPDPVNDYAVSKLSMEYMARTFSDRLPIIITRPFNYIGVGQSPNFLVAKIVDHIRRHAPVIELGNIDVERDWSDVRTIVDAYVRLTDCAAAIGGTFNVASGKPRSLQELLTIACTIGRHEMEIRINPAFVRANEVRSLFGNRDRIEGVIGPLKDYPIEDTLRWMLEMP